MIKFQLLGLWLQTHCPVLCPRTMALGPAKRPRRRDGEEGSAATQPLGQHLSAPACWLGIAIPQALGGESPSLPACRSWEQSQAVPPGKAPRRNEPPAPPRTGSRSQVRCAPTVCYKPRWKRKGLRVVFHLPFWSAADRHPSTPGHKPRRDLSAARDLPRELLGPSHPGAKSWTGATRQHQGSCIKTSSSLVVVYPTTYSH